MANPLNIPSFMQQNLLLEFTSLKTTCPPGLYLSLSPNSKFIWHVAYFPRKGPFANGIYMFTLHFPLQYPKHAPVLKCTTQANVSHPLIDPISGEVSLVEIFPPEGSGKQLPPVPGEVVPLKLSQDASVLDMLRYLKRVFEDEDALKRIPNWAIRNGPAMRAWREGRGKEVVGLGVLDAETAEQGEVVGAFRDWKGSLKADARQIRFVDLPPDVEREVYSTLGIEGP